MPIFSVRDFEQLVNEIDYVKPQKTVSSSPIGHGVIVLVSMSTSSQRTSMRKSQTCTFFHFPILGAELMVLTHIKPQVVRFVFPDGHLVIVLASGQLRILV